MRSKIDAQKFDEVLTEVYRAVLGYCRNETLAKEITSTVLEEAWQQYGFDPTSWDSRRLRQRARSRWIDHVRRDARGQAKLRLLVFEPDQTSCEPPGQALEQYEVAMEMLAELSPVRQQMMVLKYVHDFTALEIAELLDRADPDDEAAMKKAAHAVIQALYESKQTLRQKLKDRKEGD